MIKTYSAAIVGVTGYTGAELIRILENHPFVSIDIATSESKKGTNLSEIYPWHKLEKDITVTSMDDVAEQNPDIVFLALPHGVSMHFIKKYGRKCSKIVDLSGDFRLSDKEVYEKWYEMEHCCPEFMKEAVYGMPELFRDEIRNGWLIANPGCFPTSVIIPLIPFIEKNLIDPGSIISDSKTGVSGAGAKAKQGTHFTDVFGNFKAYKLKHHRHTPEMEDIIARKEGVRPTILFTPHLLPVDRGILSTIYADAKEKTSGRELIEIYKKAFETHPFVRVFDHPPTIKAVRGSNFIDIFADYDERTNRVIMISVIDNLVKGASGAAIANMNLMLGIDESAGLKALPIMP